MIGSSSGPALHLAVLAGVVLAALVVFAVTRLRRRR
jgi:hypothetical protein